MMNLMREILHFLSPKLSKVESYKILERGRQGV